jgi:hypothetical protein
MMSQRRRSFLNSFITRKHGEWIRGKVLLKWDG